MGVMILMIALVLLIALGLAALRWGVDTTDGPDSPEWERRRTWRGYTPYDTNNRSRALKSYTARKGRVRKSVF